MTSRPAVTGKRSDGTEFAAEISISQFTSPTGRQFTATVRDITERRRAEDELRRLALTDALTGAANRRHFMERAAFEFARMRRYGNPVSLVMLDVDHFKRVNDTHGHAAGDAALILLVKCCRALLRDTDLVGRLGGEEFALLLPDATTRPHSWWRSGYGSIWRIWRSPPRTSPSASRSAWVSPAASRVKPASSRPSAAPTAPSTAPKRKGATAR